MKITAAQIAEVLEGVVEGDASVQVSTLSKIEEGKPGSISFLSNPKYNHYIYTTDASIVIVNNTFEAERPVKPTLIRVEDAYKAFSKIPDFINLI